MTNKEGLWKSDDPWKFEDFDGKFVNIVNTKKNEVLGIRKSDNSTGRVISGGVWSHLPENGLFGPIINSWHRNHQKKDMDQQRRH